MRTGGAPGRSHSLKLCQLQSTCFSCRDVRSSSAAHTTGCRSCPQVGIHSTLFRLPDNVVEADVRTIVEQLSNDIAIDGILVQLPLPDGLKEELILENVSPVKDVDGGHLRSCIGDLGVGDLGVGPHSLRTLNRQRLPFMLHMSHIVLLYRQTIFSLPHRFVTSQCRVSTVSLDAVHIQVGVPHAAEPLTC